MAELQAGVGQANRTILCVSVVLTTAQQVSSILEQMHMLWRHRHDENIGLVLLTDWAESHSREPTEKEAELLRRAIISAETMSRDAASPFRGRTFVLHRTRTFCQTQRAWLGRERKRGKLEDLVKLVATDESEFCHTFGDLSWLRSARFLVAIDEDTFAPADSVLELIAAAAHPSNAPRLSIENRRVKVGYGAFAPTSYIRPGATWITRAAYFVCGRPHFGADFPLQANEWFNVFGERGFSGQGIINIWAAYHTTCRTFPSERLLSHDVIEGAVLRTGHVSSSAFIGATPSTYIHAMERWHRWIRGDWQNLFITLGFPGENGKRLNRSSLSMASTVYMLDLICRSLYYPSLIVLLIPLSAASATTAAWLVIALFVPCLALVRLSFLVVRKLLLLWPVPNVSAIAYAVLDCCATAAVCLICMLHSALVSIDAIARTLWRIITRKQLLEWVPFSTQAHRNASHTRSFATLCLTPPLALTIAWYMHGGAGASVLATAVLGCWFLAPPILARLRFF